ncbi:Hypothetical predicted protein, partial [Paramuricea clavata]
GMELMYHSSSMKVVLLNHWIKQIHPCSVMMKESPLMTVVRMRMSEYMKLPYLLLKNVMNMFLCDNDEMLHLEGDQSHSTSVTYGPHRKSRCQTPGCTAKPDTKYHFVGITAIVISRCSSGHNNRFTSSHELNDIYANNLQTATSIMLSGSNFAKVERMAKFLNLEFISSSTYYRFQRLYMIPEINEWWSSMRREIIGQFHGKDVVVGGDGQCDSPGINAKNLCYFMVEVESHYILDIEVLDKRHVDLKYTNMEKEAVHRSLDRLRNDLKVVELVTDASTSVKHYLVC